jgi:hypothetical protein
VGVTRECWVPAPPVLRDLRGNSHESAGKTTSREVDRREEGLRMPKEARVALLLTASACLLAVLIDWTIAELRADRRTTVHTEYFDQSDVPVARPATLGGT